MTSISLRAGRLAAATAAAFMLAACAAWQATTPSLESAAQTLKVNDTPAVEFSGTGRWFQFGQAPAPGTPWPAFDVSRYNAGIDYTAQASRVQITRKQVIEAGRERPAPTDQSVDQYVAGTTAWSRAVTAAGANVPPATPQPAAVAERAAEIWSTPQGFVRAALANQATTRAAGGSTEVSFKLAANNSRYVGWINAKGQVEKVQTWVDTPVLGDTLVETRYSDYRDFDGLPFPTRLERSQGGHPVLSLKVAQARRVAALPQPVPPEVANAKPAPVNVVVTALAPGVYYLTGGTHHSVAIEQRDHVVLVEAPQNEARSLALLAKLKETLPGKPVKFLINTHAHFDHSGGLRTFVDAGATIVTQQDNRVFYEQVWAAPRSIEPDRLAGSGKAARFETFRGKHVLSDGQRSIEIHEIAGNGHNDAFALVYLPKEKILVEADAYTPTAANVPPPAVPNPFTVNLYQNVLRLKLDVAQIAALHGPRVVTLADLRAAANAGAQTTAAAQ